jgi:L-amino acid N-acyltransferase YncA
MNYNNAFNQREYNGSTGPVSLGERADWFVKGAAAGVIIVSCSGPATVAAGIGRLVISAGSLGYGTYKKLEEEGIVP